MKLKFTYWVVGICFFGCTPSEPAAKSVPTTVNAITPAEARESLSKFSEALQRLNVLAETISKAFQANTPDDAHDSLHSVGHLLESIPGLANHLSDEKKTVFKVSVDELFECYGALDETMHGGPDTPYSKVAERIRTAMAALRSASE